MMTKKILIGVMLVLAATLSAGCKNKVFKDYFNSHDSKGFLKGLYIPSDVLTPDDTSPDISTVTTLSHTRIRVVFFDKSEKLDATSAETSANYTIRHTTGAHPDVMVTGAELQSDNLTVILTVQGTPANDMVHGEMYMLNVNGVKDNHENAIINKQANFVGRGSVMAELMGAPVNPTNVTATDITVDGDDIVSYRYKLDEGSWSGDINVSNHIQLSGLSDATYTLYVVGKDSLGNEQSFAASTTHTWTVDTIAPTAVLSNKPANPTNQTSTNIAVIGTGVVAYKYRIDGGSWSAEIDSGTHITATGLIGNPPTSYTIDVIGKDQAGNWQSDSSPTTHTWTVDTVSPVAELSGVPADPTNIQDIAVTVGGTDIIEYDYQIDGGGWVNSYPIQPGIDISNQIVVTGLGEGSHTLEVMGLDGAGNWQNVGTPTTITWTVDITAPTAIFTSNPPDPSNNVNPTFTVGGTQVATFRYRVDGGLWSGLNLQSSPINLSGLEEGSHTIAITGRDQAGNEQPLAGPTVYNWDIDLTAPTATLSGTPANPINSQTISVTVGGADVKAYMYKIDSESWSAETPIATLISRSGLSEGAHTLYVVGKDTAGNWQAYASATTHGWTIDITPPTATLAGTPPNPTNQTDINVIVAGTGVVSYKYQIDSGGWSAEVTTMSTHITASGLSAGGHVLQVIGKDQAGNWQLTGNSTNHNWTIDLSVPTAVLSGLPANPINSQATDITVGGTDIVSYRYQLDGGGWSAETVIATHIQLSGLSEASHTLGVVAKNSAGTWQAFGSPTTHTWTVDITPPTATLSGTPASTVNYNTTDITVAGTGVTHYKYRLDGGGWSAETAVATHIQLSGLSQTSHTLNVIGRDLAGNWQATGSSTNHTWTVDMTPPAAPAVSDTGAYDTDVNLDFTWTNGGDVAEVLLQIATDAGFTNIVYGTSNGVSVGTAQSYTYTASASNGPRYYARVKVRDAVNNWSAWGTASNGIDIAGGLTGTVKDTTLSTVSGATVNLYLTAGHVFVATTTTDTNGIFTFATVPIGSLAYTIEVSKTGYYNASKSNITVTVGVTTNIGIIYIVSTAATSAKILGRSVDANTGNDVVSTTLNIYTWDGTLAQTLTTSSSNGTFTSNTLSPGVYTLVFSKTGYFDLSFDGIPVDGRNGNTGDTTNSRYALCEILTEPHVRVIVQWGSDPHDLDLHVVGPTNKNNTSDGTPYNRFHVYWSTHKSWNENTGAYASGGDPAGTSSTTSLVQDDINSYGPESINLFGYGSGYAYGIYTYTVHDYSQTNWYATSTPTTMRVFDSQGLVMQLSLPTGGGTNYYWKAIKINCQGPARSQRTITVENTFSGLTFSSKSSMNW
jgi:hypothetical protein